jgi:ABC-type antimicrobial peptide transport system permease subunit
MIYLWVNDELHVNTFHKNDERLFFVLQNTPEGDVVRTGEGTPGLLAKTLAEEIPEVEYAVSVMPPNMWSGNGVVTVGANRFKTKTQFASKDFFKVFSYELIEGDRDKVLADKNGVAISEDLSKKLFNTAENVIGKTIEWKDGDKAELYTISGLFANPPANSTEQFDLIFSYEILLKESPWLETWGSSDPLTYVVLKEGTSIETFNSKIKDFIKSKDKSSNATLFAQQYSQHYLHGRFENGVHSGGRIEYVRLFSLIAIFILVIACINFMNLSTAKASRRIKEVGIKKAIGAGRRGLILQYMGESVLMSFLSLAFAVLATDLLLSPFNMVTGKQLTLHFDPSLMISLFGIALFTGVLAGSYPALYLSGFSPAIVLKGKINSAFGDAWARKGLVVFQFSLSILLIVLVIVVYRQMNYIQSRNLGYNRDHVIYFETENVSNAFMTEVKGIPGVVNAARFYHDLTGNHGGTSGLSWEGKQKDQKVEFGNLEVGYDLIETLGFQMAEGKPFSEDFGSIDQIIFNEAAIEAMGLKDPIGKTIEIWDFKRQIVGVVKNFNFESLYEEVEPCFLFLVPMVDGIPTRIMVKIQQGEEKATLARLEKFFQKNNPGLPFDFRFVDDDYQRMYASEQRVATLSMYFAGMAILISCLGLFGLAAFTAERRLKEIGIRKILGSDSAGIVYLLSGDFTKMVLLAIVVALPTSYFLAKSWLSSFAYKPDLELWYFFAAGFGALVVAWLTVSVQTIKAASVNPTDCLKDE